MKGHDRRVRVQVFSGSSSNYRQFELSLRGLLFLGVLLGLGLALVLAGGFFLYNKIAKDISLQAFVYESMKFDSQMDGFGTRARQISRDIAESNGAADDSRINFLIRDQNGSSTEFPVAFEDYANTTASAGDNIRPAANGFADTARIGDILDNLEARLQETRRLQREIKNEQIEDELKRFPSITPLQRGRISDLYGLREDPFGKTERHHNGLDIAAPRGTKVFAPAAGVVELAQNHYSSNRGYGRMVIINHGNGMKTLYGHLHKIFVKPGDEVRRYDVIGLVGSTGRSTGPHLHYEIIVDGKPIDPMTIILK